MHYAADKLSEEEQRGKKYLETGSGAHSVQLLLQKLVDVLVVSFQEQLLSECPQMIAKGEIESQSQQHLHLTPLSRLGHTGRPMLAK